MKRLTLSFRKSIALTTVGAATVWAGLGTAVATAQMTAGEYHTDPQTGNVYRKTVRTIERPVTETTVQKQTTMVYRPETVTQIKPQQRTVYTPVTEHFWQPRVHGRWNPFVTPTVAYHHVPVTRWKANTETVERRETRTNWVAENRTLDVPVQTVRMQRQDQVDYQLVGRVAPNVSPAATSTNGQLASARVAPTVTTVSGRVDPTLAARLRPIQNHQRIDPMAASSPAPMIASGAMPGAQYGTGSIGTSGSIGTAGSTGASLGVPRLAATTIGRMTTDPPRRSVGQRGLRVQELTPTRNTIGSPLPSTSIARPTLPMLR